tara:strand:- start:61 stop:351 length:291 start_codon:yes stop_codon:yes gene_type:complete
MDVSRKLYKEDIITLNELQTELLRQDKRVTQKDLIDQAIQFSNDHKKQFLSFVSNTRRKDNTKEMTEKFLSLPKSDLGDNWMEEIDTIHHNGPIKK